MSPPPTWGNRVVFEAALAAPLSTGAALVGIGAAVLALLSVVVLLLLLRLQAASASDASAAAPIKT